MPSKLFEIEDIGKVKVVRSKRSKHIRLSVKSDNTILVSAPYWTPYRIALEFVHRKKDWILSNLSHQEYIYHGDKIGKAHRLLIESTDVKRPYSTVKNNEIIVKFPRSMDISSMEIQNLIKKKSIQALTIEAESLLPQRLRVISERHNLPFSCVNIKTLKSRWGSCNSKKEITLSCYLMQLSWKEIDYVIVHELAHTIHMSHDKKFWNLVVSTMPDALEFKKILNTKKPNIIAQ